jgi:tRNA(fMet)-specific endonuclease VapC
MSLWILDTDCFSFFQQGHPLVRQRVSSLKPEEIATTIITFEEQVYGRLNRIRRSNSREELVLAYAKLRDTLEDFRRISLLDFDNNASTCYAELISQKIRIGTQDLRIGAIAISKNAILVTRNRRDFERILGLVLEDWTVI